LKFIPAHVPFIAKSNSENYVKKPLILTKLRIKISWLLFMAHDVECGPMPNVMAALGIYVALF